MCLRPVAEFGVVVAAEVMVLDEGVVVVGVVVVLLVLTWSLTHSVRVNKNIHALLQFQFLGRCDREVLFIVKEYIF